MSESVHMFFLLLCLCIGVLCILRLDHICLDQAEIISPLWVATYGDEDYVTWLQKLAGSMYLMQIRCQPCTKKCLCLRWAR